MSVTSTRRVDPRALLRTDARADLSRREALRMAGIGLAAAIGLGAFGGVVVRANEDAGVLAFIRQQTRAIQPQRFAPVAVQPPARAYLPSLWPTARRAPDRPVEAARAAPQPRYVASYAPLVAAPMTALSRQEVSSAPLAAPRISGFVPLATPIHRPAGIARGGRIAYCVRTCDGFFFPIGAGAGGDAAEAAVCQQLCPGAETRVYAGRIGQEIDEARGRLDGKRYALLPTALRHRTRSDATCSCVGGGPGVATDIPARRDPTLRIGDVVMTATGMKVFNGGALPYRDASFTAAGRSALIDARTRETLRRMELASLPGRSGLEAPVRQAQAMGPPAPERSFRAAITVARAPQAELVGFRVLEAPTTR